MARVLTFSDPVYQGDTRPAAPGGVPLGLAVGLLMIFFIGAAVLMLLRRAGLGLGLLALYLPAWGLLRWWVDGDLRKSEVVLGWFMGAARTPIPMATAFGGLLLGVSTVSPLADTPDDFGMPGNG